MRLKPGRIKDLPLPFDRACARLAQIAVNDTVHGGAAALVVADTMRFRGEGHLSTPLPPGVPAREIVGDVYALSSGNAGSRWGVFECPECGSSHLGQENAFACCADRDDEGDS